MAVIAAHLNAGGGDSVAIGIIIGIIIISLFPHIHIPSLSPSLINLMVSVDVKHRVYLQKGFD